MVNNGAGPAKTTLYMSVELQSLVKEIKKLSGSESMATALTVAAREYVDKRREITNGFELIPVVGFFEGKHTLEKRVFTGRWLIHRIALLALTARSFVMQPLFPNGQLGIADMGKF